MATEEKARFREVAATLEEAIPLMDDYNRGRLVGYGTALISFREQQKKEKEETAAEQKETA